jgi:hypothetical protein
MAIADAVKPVKTLDLDELGKAVADKFAKVAWGPASPEANNKIGLPVTLQNLLGDPLIKKERLRLTCTAGATMALGPANKGTVLAGSGTSDLLVETDLELGLFDLEVTYAGTGTVTVVAGASQGSSLVDCSASTDLLFA